MTAYNDDIQLCLLGDFNARTGQLSDSIQFDDHGNLLESEDMFGNYLNCITDSNPRHARVNSDKILNSAGRRLIELCRSLNLIIMNGRYGKDINIGKKTCKNASTVDYILYRITSVNMCRTLKY